jgi:hypothetical protein
VVSKTPVLLTFFNKILHRTGRQLKEVLGVFSIYIECLFRRMQATLEPSVMASTYGCISMFAQSCPPLLVSRVKSLMDTAVVFGQSTARTDTYELAMCGLLRALVSTLPMFSNTSEDKSVGFTCGDFHLAFQHLGDFERTLASMSLKQNISVCHDTLNSPLSLLIGC